MLLRPLPSPSGQTNFDDIVTFKEPWQLQTQNFALLGNCSNWAYIDNAAGSYGWHFDAGGNCLGGGASGFTDEIIDKYGRPWGHSASSSTVTIYSGSTVLATFGSFSGPKGMLVDTYGNGWIADSGHNQVLEYSSSNNYASAIGSITSGLSTPYFVAFDTNNNLWVADTGDAKVPKIQLSGPNYF